MTSTQESFWTKWGRFWKLSPLQRKLTLHAMLFLPLTEAGLRVMGFRRWKQLIEYFSRSAAQQPIPKPEARLEMTERIVRAVGAAERHAAGTPTCLERSLTLWWLLRRDAVDVELHIGARKSGSRLEAHAWVEVGGVVLNDSADVHKHYARFDAPIAAGIEGSD